MRLHHAAEDGYIDPGSLIQPQPKAAFAYWDSLRQGRAMPAPADIDPTKIPKLLPYITLIEVLHGPPPDYLFRIDGEAVRLAIGFRRMGRRLSELQALYGQEAYLQAQDHYASIVATGRPTTALGRLSRLGRRFYRLEIAHMPLSADGLRVDRIFCCIGLVERPEELARLDRLASALE